MTKGIKILSGLLLVGVLVFVGYFIYSKNQQSLECPWPIDPYNNGYRITYLEPGADGGSVKDFETENEAMEWCKENFSE